MANVYGKNLSESLLRSAVIDDHMNELDSIPSEDELREMYTFSNRHEARMRELFRQEKRRESKLLILRIARCAAIFIVIFCTLLFGLLLTDAEVRATVGDTIRNWFDGFTRYTFHEDSAADDGIEWIFGFVPEGFTRVERVDVGDSVLIIYVDAESNEVMLHYALGTDISFGVDNEQVKFELIYYGGNEYHVYESTSDEFPSRIIWLQDGYAFNLEGYVSVEDLLRMAKTVAPK